jgi:hypothetical protein
MTPPQQLPRCIFWSTTTMPRIKSHDNKTAMERDLEDRYKEAIQGLDDGTFNSLSQAAWAYNVSKSTLAHRKNGRKSRQAAHTDEQTFSPPAEKAIVKWILRLDDWRFLPRLDHLMQKVEFLASQERANRSHSGDLPKDVIGKNWITKFLNRNPILAATIASRIDRQRAYTNNPQLTSANRGF